MGEVVNFVIFCGANKIVFKHFNDSDKIIGCCWLGGLLLYFLQQNMLKWMRRQRVSYINQFIDDVTICFCDIAEEIRAFSSAHLQAVWDHYFDFINGIDRGQQGENITEVPCILLYNGHVPESIFDVEFGK